MENIPDQEIDPSLEATNLLSTEAQIRKIIQEQIIECLNRFYAIESGLWGKPINALILRTIFKGHLQDLPYDMSALSECLDLPLTTTHRKVHELITTGYIEQKLVGKSMLLLPTEKTQISLDKSFGDMMETITKLYRAV
ncbi:MAG: hypothetical protein JJ964_07900 [Rhizobiales bacterium]|nr:hypothetical protein [Hyphomicrobiales bacterium]